MAAPSHGTVVVGLLGTGVLVEPDHEPEIAALMQILGSGDVVGSGPGGSGASRLQALADTVETAGDLIRLGELEDACGQLDTARLRVDGVFPPPDFLEPGLGVSELHEQLIELQLDLGCELATVPAPKLARKMAEGCGLGFELPLLLAPLGWAAARRRRRAACRSAGSSGSTWRGRH